MAADSIVRARIPAEVKARAFAALEQIGLNASDLIRLTFMRVAESGQLPFELTAPNADTRRAMAELDAGKGQRFERAEDVFNHLGL